MIKHRYYIVCRKGWDNGMFGCLAVSYDKKFLVSKVMKVYFSNEAQANATLDMLFRHGFLREDYDDAYVVAEAEEWLESDEEIHEHLQNTLKEIENGKEI